MYSTCIFCQKPLGANEAIEQFPVGKRLVFDEARGRLWVVCRRCERWNLTPLDTRWEAIEECERAFHAARLRTSTDNIGLAKAPDGLDLIRIGKPLRPEFAAWRYGDQFGRRRRRTYMIGGGVILAFGAVAATSIGSLGGLWGNLPNIIRAMHSVNVKTHDGRVLKIRGAAFSQAKLTADNGTPTLRLKHKRREEVFEGEEAVRVVATLLPAVNFAGASQKTVDAAVKTLAHHGGSEGYLESLWAGKADALTKTTRKGVIKPVPLASLKGTAPITIEMALHEEQERRAIAGELHVLETAWKDAEEIAAIADDMFVPDETEALIQKMKREVNDPNTPT